MNCTSRRTIEATKDASFTRNQESSLTNNKDDHQNKGSNHLSQSYTSRQTPARTLQAPSNKVRIADGGQARLTDQQSSKTRLQEQEKRILKFAYPHVDEVVFFEDAFGFIKPSSVLVQQVWERAIKEESESLGQQSLTHFPKASHAIGKEVCILLIQYNLSR